MYEAPGRFSILDFIIFKNNLYFIFNSSYFGEVAVIHVFAFLFLLMKKKSWIFITLQCSLKCPMFQTRINLSRALLLPSHVPHTIIFFFSDFMKKKSSLFDSQYRSMHILRHSSVTRGIVCGVLVQRTTVDFKIKIMFSCFIRCIAKHCMGYMRG
jgi:hypothetical protein